jgi:hypothetical protein
MRLEHFCSTERQLQFKATLTIVGYQEMSAEEIVQGRKPACKYRDLLSDVLLNGLGETLIHKCTMTKAKKKKS